MTVISHNHEVQLPRPMRDVLWYMAAGSGPLCFIFIHKGTGKKIEKTPADGWSLDDAHAFHRWLMGWEHADQLYKLKHP